MNLYEYLTQTYERHDGDLFAIHAQLVFDYREAVPEAVAIVDKFHKSITPFTDAAQ